MTKDDMSKMIQDFIDDYLSKWDNEYDNVKATYKGKPNYSMAKYLTEKFGKDVKDVIESLI